MKTLILRHRRENLRKCSLRGLETHPDLAFYTYPTHILPDLTGYLLLEVGAPPLTEADQGYGLLLIDATWKLAEPMRKSIAYSARSSLVNSGGPQSGSDSRNDSSKMGCSDGPPNSPNLTARHIQPILARSLPPGFKTAYPRKQTGCPDPESGLASVEALYLAHKILNRATEGLLDHYYWEEKFLAINALRPEASAETN